jgi:uncharacterized membrane protein YcaP (DUF421 family)
LPIKKGDVMYGFVDVLADIFGSDVPRQPLELHQVAARAALVYIIGLAIVRVGKSRLIGRVTSLDVILGFILGSLLSRGITGSASVSGTTVASAALVATHWVFTFLASRSHAFGTLVKGRAIVVVKEGELIRENMRRSHISEHDLEEELRLQGIDSLQEVRLAHKERNGEVSFLIRKPEPRIIDVAVSGGVQTVRIQLG